MDAPPRYRRSIVIASCGIVLAVISLVVIAIVLRTVTPESLSLAYRISSADTVLFLRTSDSDVLRKIVTRFEDDLGELPTGLSYELAILHPPEGQIEWIIETQKEDGARGVFGTKDPAALLLPPKDIGRSVGQSVFFRQHVRTEMTDVAYSDLSRLSLVQGDAQTLLSAAVAPFSHAVLLWNNGGAHLTLQKKEAVLFPENVPGLTPMSFGSNTMLTLAASDPATIIGTFSAHLAKRDPGLAQGLKGILQQWLENVANRTDLEAAKSQLLSNPAGLAISDTGSVVWGTAGNDIVAHSWVESLDSAMTPAIIRRQTFFAENSRTDVLAETGQQESEWNGWTLTPVDASGSELHLTAARKGARFAVGGSKPLLMTTLQSLDHPGSPVGVSPRTFEGSMNVPWVLQSLEEHLPFLAPAVREILELAGPRSIIAWSAVDEAATVTVRLRFP